MYFVLRFQMEYFSLIEKRAVIRFKKLPPNSKHVQSDQNHGKDAKDQLIAALTINYIIRGHQHDFVSYITVNPLIRSL